ncbi:hypothetical protein [Seonamhaeicola maritimus]|uniref:Uncharacterized protein n=1 Tax=Seonamhaeicola maritimus TaxID=2591822 RepID=A0A5C7GKD3_9FLAO|nr:hypothetical protein [Seonamhaeicola maritimus]TXG38685.1 hypothetical protein FUA22_02030 [Seonamhaeicola maritimus]
MPLAESMLSTLKSNRNIMLDKSRRFRKTVGGYAWSKDELIDFPKASKKELNVIRNKIQKENRKTRIRQWLTFLIIFIILFSTFLYFIN